MTMWHSAVLPFHTTDAATSLGRLPSPEALREAPADEIPALLAKLAALQAVLLARLIQSEAGRTPAPQPMQDELLTAEQVAPRLHVTKAWVYKNWKRKLRAFARPISPGLLRFSKMGLERYLANLKAGG